MILGGGPNRIGQGIEFDYCCCHASFALRAAGFATVMVNSNPETVSTDYDTSDRLYFEPLTLEDVLNVIEAEKPEGVIVQFGGQTPLKLAVELENEQLDPATQAEIDAELESSRKRADALTAEITTLERHLKKSKESLGLDNAALREAVSCSLELLKHTGLKQTKLANGQVAFKLPQLEAARGGAADWADTLDTLRAPPKDGDRDHRWRSTAPIRPVVFEAQSTLDESTVHLHLEHRVVQRLLGRFLAQGFVHHDLSRTCLGASRDEHARVVLLGRLALYGGGAARLHEEIVAVSARWSDPAKRTKLSPEGAEASRETLEWLQQHLNQALGSATAHELPAAVRARLYTSVARARHVVFTPCTPRSR
jgi:hypothetical protein